MYSIENIKYFLENSEVGKSLDDDIKNAILQRAQESVIDDGGVRDVSTRYIFANIHIEQLFEEALRRDPKQTEILSDFAEKCFRMNKNN